MAMPLCITVDADNQLVNSGQFTGDCTGYVLMTAADYTGSMTMAQLFGPPDAEVFAAFFMGFFGLVLGCAVVAHAVGSVAGFFDHHPVEEL